MIEDYVEFIDESIEFTDEFFSIMDNFTLKKKHLSRLKNGIYVIEPQDYRCIRLLNEESDAIKDDYFDLKRGICGKPKPEVKFPTFFFFFFTKKKKNEWVSAIPE